jgi:hypothetical protein
MYDEEYNEYGIEISQEIKDDVHEYKKKTTKFMDKVKTAFFIYLIAKKGVDLYSKRVDKEYRVYIKDIDKLVKASLKKFNIKDVDTEAVKDIMERFKIDRTSTKTEDDKYIQVIKKFYSKTLKTLDKEWISEKDYLSAKVDEFDKVEKVVRYDRRKKDGNFVYFDIASYDSMVYNTNLTRTGIRETIKDSIIRDYDVVYIDPHPFSCPLCQTLQGKFYSITGETEIYNGMMIESLEEAQNQGLFHPNCTHIPRKAYLEDRVSDRYTSEIWEERYNVRQKLNAIELEKERLKSDISIYEKLGNMEQVDKEKQKLKRYNEKIRELKKEGGIK